MTLVLLAEDSGVSAIAGSSGWVGAGLLGLVLCWLLFFHLPAKDKQLAAMIGEHNLLVAGLHKDCQTERTQQFTNYKATLDEIATRTTTAQRESSRELGDELKALATVITALKTTVEQLGRIATR